MRRRRIIQTQLEGWEPWEFTRERLAKIPRVDLEHYYRDFIGGAWYHIRSLSKATLVEIILKSRESDQ